MKDKRNNIVEKATTLFMHKGLHSVSMEDIASYAGISKKTLYGDFESKEVLVKTIVHKSITKTSKYMRLGPEVSPNGIKELENVFQYMLGMLDMLTPKFIRDLKKYYPEAYTELIAFRDNSIIPYLERCLDRGITEEIFRPDIERRKVAWLYSWQLQNVMEGDSFPPDVRQFISGINDLFLHSILNPTGLKLLTMSKQKERARQNQRLV